MDWQGKRVAILGDSLSASASSPGGRLAAELEELGAVVLVRAQVGRSAYNFYGREDAEAELRGLTGWQPELVIVQLGTNDLGIGAPGSRAHWQRLGADLAGQHVMVLGAPSFPGRADLARRLPELYALQETTFPGQVIDSRPLTSARGRSNDGVHFTAQGAAELGHAWREALEAELGQGPSPWGLLGLAFIIAGLWWALGESA
jgi:lysophospholipase L1-like esterase